MPIEKDKVVSAIEYLQLGVEQYLRELPDDEFEELARRVRPTLTEAIDAESRRSRDQQPKGIVKWQL